MTDLISIITPNIPKWDAVIQHNSVDMFFVGAAREVIVDLESTSE